MTESMAGTFHEALGNGPPSGKEATIDEDASRQVRSKPLIVKLGLIVACGAILRGLVFTGYHGEDDFFYVALANELAEGRDATDGSYWQGRAAMTAPLAVLFYVAGPSLGTMAALPFVWSLSCIVLTYLIGRAVYDSERIALIGALLIALFPMNVVMASIYLPAMGIAAFTAASFLFFLAGLRHGHGAWYAFSGISLGVAYMHRITAVFMFLPLLLWVAIERRWRHGYFYAAAGFALIVVAEMVWFTVLFDEPLYRMHRIVGRESSSARHVSHGGNLSQPGTFITRPLASLFFEQEYGLFYYFMIPGAIYLVLRRDRRSTGLLLWFGAVGLYTLWGTVSVSRWMPLYSDPRYMSIVTVPGVLLLARWLVSLRQTKWRRLVIATLLVTSGASIYLDKHRDYRNIGHQLLVFKAQHTGRPLIVTGKTYAEMFVANGMKPLQDVAFLGPGTLGWTRTLDPEVKVFQNRGDLDDCFVAVSDEDLAEAPHSWRRVERIERPRRWYVAPLEKRGGIFEKLASRLSWSRSYTIFRVPAKSEKRSVRALPIGSAPKDAAAPQAMERS